MNSFSLNHKPKMVLFVFSTALATSVMFQNCAATGVTASDFDASNSSYSAPLQVQDTSLKRAPAAVSSVPESTPSIQIFLSSKLDGPAQKSFTVNQVVFGKVTGLSGANIASCLEEVGISSECANGNYRPLPNDDWTFQDGVWRAAITINSSYAGKTFRGRWLDRNTGKASAFFEFEVPAVSSSGTAVSSSNSDARNFNVGPN